MEKQHRKAGPASLAGAILPALAALVLAACALSADEESAGRTPFDPDLYGWKTASWFPFTQDDPISAFAYGICGGEDRYVAVSTSGIIAWSNDGDIWNRALQSPPADPDIPEPDPFDSPFYAAVFGKGIFIAAGANGKVALSADGIYWRSGPRHGIAGFGSTAIRGLAFGNDTFVAVGDNANISCSADGRAWTGGTVPSFGGQILNAVAFGNGRFYAAGQGGCHGWSENPADPSAWHSKSTAYPPFHANDIRALAVGRYGEGTGIIVAYNEWDGKRLAIANNADFGNNAGDWDDDIDAGFFGNNGITSVAWANGNFIAAGQAAMIGYWPSGEPSNESQRYWRALSFPEFQWWEISAAAACKDRFFIGGLGGKIGYSK
jgi:hypothetical protein